MNSKEPMVRYNARLHSRCQWASQRLGLQLPVDSAERKSRRADPIHHPRIAADDMSENNTNTLILVTGGSGFISLHCIAQALNQGYKVRTTVRSKAKESNVLAGLKNAQPPVNLERLEFVVADLLSDEGWTAATTGASLVLHVASPFPASTPEHEDDLIRPAVDGTLRVLKAAKAAGSVKRVVVTSSIASISYGTPLKQGQSYTEEDWSDTQGRGSVIPAYPKSKTLAEQAAWEYIKTEGSPMELATVNPGGVFGPPLLIPTESTTCSIVKQMLEGALPAVPNITFGMVDVRDVAALHLLAATKPEANGQRYVCVAGPSVSLRQMAQMLRDGLGTKASRAPTMILPNFLVRVVSVFMKQLKSVVPDVGVVKEYDNSKARALGWEPRSNDEAIISCGQALLDAGDVK